MTTPSTALCALFLLGCAALPVEHDAARPPDASISAEIPPPTPPSPVDLRCPENWWVTEDGRCTPTEATTEPCGAHERRVDGACLPIGPECPAARFPDDIAGDLLYVDQAADGARANGTRDAPFLVLRDALARARAGTTIVVAPGTYAGQVVLEDGVSIRGSCLGTVLVGASDAARGVIEVQGAGVAIRDLAIRSEVQRGVQVLSSTNDASVSSVVIEIAHDVAINVGRGATLRASDVAVRQVLGAGRAVNVQEGSAAELEELEVTGATLFVSGAASRLRLERSLLGESRILARAASSLELGEVVVARPHGTGVHLEGAAVLDAEGLTILEPVSDGPVRLMLVASGARGSVSRLYARGGVAVGIQVGGEGSTLRLERALVERVRSDPGYRSAALQVDEGAALSLSSVRLHDVEGSGISAAGSLTASDIWIHDVGVARSGSLSCGVVISADARMERLRIEDQRGIALWVDGAAARARIDDLQIRRISGYLADESTAIGIGAWVVGGATLQLRRATVEGTRYASLQALQGSSIVAEDLLLRDATPELGSNHAPALELSASRAELTRVRIERSLGWGLDLFEGSVLRARDLVVEAVQPLDQPWSLGWGISVQAIEGSQVEIIRARLAGAVGVALWLEGEGTSGTLEDTDIVHTAARTCADGACADAPAGMGIGVYAGARLSMRRFDVAHSAFCGLQLGPAAAVDLSDGAFRANDIGLCVHESDYDLDRLTAGVRFEANELAIDSVSLPIPSAPRPPGR